MPWLSASRTDPKPGSQPSTHWPTSLELAGYHYLPAARADQLRRLDRTDEARQAYEEALLLTENAVERAFLETRLAAHTQVPEGLTDGDEGARQVYVGASGMLLRPQQ